MQDRVALIVGAGAGLSAALAKRCAARGMAVQLAARNTEKLNVLNIFVVVACYRNVITFVGFNIFSKQQKRWTCLVKK